MKQRTGTGLPSPFNIRVQQAEAKWPAVPPPSCAPASPGEQVNPFNRPSGARSGPFGKPSPSPSAGPSSPGTKKENVAVAAAGPQERRSAGTSENSIQAARAFPALRPRLPVAEPSQRRDGSGHIAQHAARLAAPRYG